MKVTLLSTERSHINQRSCIYVLSNFELFNLYQKVDLSSLI